MTVVLYVIAGEEQEAKYSSSTHPGGRSYCNTAVYGFDASVVAIGPSTVGTHARPAVRDGACGAASAGVLGTTIAAIANVMSIATAFFRRFTGSPCPVARCYVNLVRHDAASAGSKFHGELSIRRRAVRRSGRATHRFPSVRSATEPGSRHPPDVTRRLP